MFVYSLLFFFEKGVKSIEMIKEIENKENSLNTIDVPHDYDKNHKEDEEIIWTYDNECSEHMTYDKNILKDFNKFDIKRK